MVGRESEARVKERGDMGMLGAEQPVGWRCGFWTGRRRRRGLWGGGLGWGAGSVGRDRAGRWGGRARGRGVDRVGVAVED
jgi:hypothetical protein